MNFRSFLERIKKLEAKLKPTLRRQTVAYYDSFTNKIIGPIPNGPHMVEYVWPSQEAMERDLIAQQRRLVEQARAPVKPTETEGSEQ